MNTTIGRGSRLGHIAAGMVLAFAVICSGRAFAEVIDSGAAGFTVRETAHVAADPAKVFAAITAPQHWWSSMHTSSHSAGNMTLDAHAGGCWCETLPNGGSALHMTVVDVEPGKTLRLRGAMGPFQEMATVVVMTWTLQPANGGTDVTLTSSTGGYLNGGLASLASVVDRVFAEQTARLKLLIETGSPENAKPLPMK